VSLNLADNNLGKIVLPAGWRSRDNDGSAPWVGPNEQQQSAKPGKAEGIIAIANVIPDMGALSSLILKSNGILNKDSGQALAEALKDNSVLTVLDVSNNYSVTNNDSQDGAGFAQELAVGIKDNGAMTSLNLALNSLGVEGAEIIAALLPECT
jgi:hypothetical protein